VEAIELRVLTDAISVAKTLTSVFPEFAVVPDGQQSTKLYVVDREAARRPQDCKKKSWKPSSSDELDNVVQWLDRDNFKGVALNSNYVISLSAISAKILGSFFRRPVPSLELGVFDCHLVSSPVASGQDATATEKQAIGVKHDLLLLDKQLSLLLDKNDQTGAEALVKHLRALVTPEVGTAPPSLQDVVREAEKWLDAHTSQLSVLGPRDVALALDEYFKSKDRALIDSRII
jgi:hypothetical protein